MRDVSIVSIDFENGSVVVCGFLLSKFIDARWGDAKGGIGFQSHS